MSSKFETNQKLSDFSKEEIENKKLIPSSQLAWMIGILSGGGDINLRQKGGTIRFYNSERNLLSKFKLVGQDLFKSNPIFSKRNGRNYQIVNFYNKKVAQEMGDLRKKKWTETLVKNHQWIFKNKQYLWNFLEGLFETRGFIKKTLKGNVSQIGFYASSRYNTANFISDLLIRVDINKLKINTNGVSFSKWHDIKNFVDNVHSISPNKEEVLEVIRNKQTKFEKREQMKREAIREWMLVKKLLSHVPSQREIERLEQNNETKFSPDVYKWRFGRVRTNEKRGSFSLAKNELEKLTNDVSQP